MATTAPAAQAPAAAPSPSSGSVPADGVAPCPLLTWIEFCLLDMEGQPVPGKQYIVKTPDGGEVRGTLDGNGQARLDGIVRGTCRISFPEYDADAWERI
jgi:hypothetical protein